MEVTRKIRENDRGHTYATVELRCNNIFQHSVAERILHSHSEFKTKFDQFQEDLEETYGGDYKVTGETMNVNVEGVKFVSDNYTIHTVTMTFFNQCYFQEDSHKEKIDKALKELFDYILDEEERYELDVLRLKGNGYIAYIKDIDEDEYPEDDDAVD